MDTEIEVMCFEAGGRGHRLSNRVSLCVFHDFCFIQLLTGKDMEIHFPLESSEGAQPYQNTDFSPLRPLQTFDLQH
jgi:hypothetical protein